MHAYLTSAINVFENWSENYLIFIRDWHKQKRERFLNRKPLDLPDFQFYDKTYDYEIFNYRLYKLFYGKNFAFLRREFENFLEKFIAGDILDELSLFDDFDWTSMKTATQLSLIKNSEK